MPTPDKKRKAFSQARKGEGFFNEETKEMAYEAIYSDYQTYRRCGFKKYNYKAFLTNLPISVAEQRSEDCTTSTISASSARARI